ncbi:hypothetical protein P3L10_026523 [Capsicum annuum]
MHIEKNFCDSLLGTLLDIVGKSKDHVNSRYDLHEMGLRKELQPIKDDNGGKVHLEKAYVKLPKRFASNISSRVQIDEMKVSGYKSHGAHFIMHHLLQVAVRKVLSKNVSLALIGLGNYFRAIYSKVVRKSDLDKMKAEIIDLECELEKIFPPTFFDIITYLPIYLVDEIKLGGPTHLRHIYPIERNLCNFKGFVRNQNTPEASIAESFLAKECLNFYSRYLDDRVKTKFSRYPIEDEEGIQIEGAGFPPIFPKIGHPIRSNKKRKGTPFDLDNQHFASARDPNPVDGIVIYYGVIEDIIEIDYWSFFIVVLFICDWFHNEVDEYGLTRINFNRKCSTDDPFVLASQVHQVFYVEDPIDKGIYNSRNKVPVDLYDLEEESCPNIEEIFWRETNDDIGSPQRVVDVDVRWSRDDLPVDIIDMPSLVQYSKDVETS